jgi:hypothetical protein
MAFFKKKNNNSSESHERGQRQEDSINSGVYYLYLIIGLQIALVFGIMATIMIVGQVLATPVWVFLFALSLGIGGVVYIYRKAKRKFNRLKEALRNVDLSGRNYEISIMGGMFTMRVEQNHRHLLEAPTSTPPRALPEAETIETPVER